MLTSKKVKEEQKKNLKILQVTFFLQKYTHEPKLTFHVRLFCSSKHAVNESTCNFFFCGTVN